MEHKEVRYTGLGFADALTLLFIALKLCKVINWPWAWVLCPLWITLIFFGVVALLVLIVSAVR